MATYYVATTGNNGNDGSQGTPWLTIQHALDTMVAGDTTLVQPGSYASAVFTASGGVGNPITLKANGTVTLVGSGTGGSMGLFNNNFDHLVIEGFDITNYDFGIEADDAADVTIRGNTLWNNQSAGAIFWRCDNIKAYQNTFKDVGAPYPASATQDYGLSFELNTSNVTVEDNVWIGKANQALSFKEAVFTATVRNNRFYGHMFTGIYIGQNDDIDAGFDATCTNITVTGNRFKPVNDQPSGTYYRAHDPIVVRNVNTAIVQDNLFDPNCDNPSVTTVGSTNVFGVAAGNNTIQNNLVQSWCQ